MDIAGEAAMIEFLRDLNQRRRVTIVIVTRLLPIVLNLATSIMLMGDHSILQGAMNDVLRENAWVRCTVFRCISSIVAGRRTSWARRQPCLNLCSKAADGTARVGSDRHVARHAGCLSRHPARRVLRSSSPTPRHSEQRLRKHSAGLRSRCRSRRASWPPPALARSVRRRGSRTNR